MIKKINKEKIIELIIILAFLALSIFVCHNHEYWADEAQSWLLARDCSVYELLTKYIHAECHPALWFFIIKIFQSFGLKYDYFYVISILFSTLGVILFVTKSKFPLYIRMLFPFTYFVFYQYTVIVRGYSLLFFILSWLATIYDDRHEKIFLYTLVMFLLLSTEAYTFFFAGMLYLIYFYEFIKNRKEYDQKTKAKHIISLITLFILFCLTVLYVYPYKTNSFFNNSIFYNPIYSFIFPCVATSNILGAIVVFALTLAFDIILYLAYKDNLKKFFEMLFLIIPIYLFYNLIYYNEWHLGIMLLLFIFVFWIHHLENNKYVLILLSATIIVQLYWSGCSINYDVKNSYSGAAKAAEFIKKYDYDKLEIFTTTYYSVGLNPYFEENIFSNWHEGKSFFYWDKRSKFYEITKKSYNKEKNNSVDYIIENDYPIAIVPYKVAEEYYDGLNEQYNYYDFEGDTYIENRKYESQTYRIYVRKDVDISIDDE